MLDSRFRLTRTVRCVNLQLALAKNAGQHLVLQCAQVISPCADSVMLSYLHTLISACDLQYTAWHINMALRSCMHD